MIDIGDVLRKFLHNTLDARFLQYHHKNLCNTPCPDCPERDKRIYENGTQVELPAHPLCDCFYENVETKKAGTISELGINGPDAQLKLFGKLPDYYITKQEAEEKYGWDNSKNTIAGKAPGKMIGGDVYYNKNHILPEKEGRVWYECDVDYKSGSRNCPRLFYSNDGLMFYSTSHIEKNIEFTIYNVN